MAVLDVLAAESDHIKKSAQDEAPFSFARIEGDEKTQRSDNNRDKGPSKEITASTLPLAQVDNTGLGFGPDTARFSQPAIAAQALRPENNMSAIADMKQLVEIGKQVLSKISPSGALVTQAQLANAVQEGSFKGQHAQAVAALYRGYLQLKSHPEGLSAGDLDKLPAIAQTEDSKFAEASRLRIWADDNLSRFGNKEGLLKHSDITKALKNPAITDQDKENLRQLKSLIPTLKKSDIVTNGAKGIKSSDLDAYIHDYLAFSSEQTMLVNDMRADIVLTANAESINVNHDLYATADPLESITADAINQGSLGDCYFLASLAAVAKSNPQAIQNAIKDNQDGTYTVTFAGAKEHAITVKAPTDAELGLFNGGGKYGVWASVMEKAYGQLMLTHPQDIVALFLSAKDKPLVEKYGKSQIMHILNHPPKTSDHQSNTPLFAFDEHLMAEALSFGLIPAKDLHYLPQDYIGSNGGSEDDMLKLLTGKNVSRDTFADKHNNSIPRAGINESVADELKTAFLSNSPHAVVADSYDPDDPNISPMHIYTVTGFNPNGKDGGSVSLRNPIATELDLYGKTKSAQPYLTLSVSEFVKNFRSLSFT